MKGSFLFKKAFKISLLLFALVFAGPGAFIAAESYTVEKGDTLYGISRRYGVSIDSLCGWNGIDKTEVLRVGQVLAIPTNTPEPSREQVSEKKYEIYKIKKGDTLYRLAMDYGLRVDQLINYNALDASVVLQIGQEIRIPVSQSEIELASLPNLPAKDPRSYSEKKGDPSLQWPVKNPEVTYMAGKVGGVCLSAKKNENVTAIHGGAVLYVGNYRGYGNVVIIVTDDGIKYIYAGLDSICVKKGDFVSFGESIGVAGIDSIKGTSMISLIVYQKTTPVDPASAPRG
ncbi:MAG: M23 family metallopeptidase [Treponema sp.]|nr:M23 family metallopeptidase [Treponema sp.]